MTSKERQSLCRQRKKVTELSQKVTKTFRDNFVTDCVELAVFVDIKEDVTKLEKKEVKELKKPPPPNPQAVADETIFKNILIKYGREDLAELARVTLAGRTNVVARLQFCDKVVKNQLNREAKASTAAAAAAIKKRKEEDQVAEEYCRLRSNELQAAGFI